MIPIASSGFFKGVLYRLAWYGSVFDNTAIPNNLCPFIRRITSGILVVVSMICVGSVLAIALLDPVASAILHIFVGPGQLHFIDESFFVLGCAIYTAILGLGVYLFVYLLMKILMCRLVLKPIRPKRTIITDQGRHVLTTYGVICEYLSALHDKICPKIEFK